MSFKAVLVTAGTALLVTALAPSAWLFFERRAESARIAAGRQLYAAHCATCHGADLQGQPDWQTPRPNGRMPAPPHDAGGHTWHHGDAELFEIVEQGMSAVVPNYSSDMPGFDGVLSDNQIRSVISFLKKTWPARERGYQDDQSRRATAASAR